MGTSKGTYTSEDRLYIQPDGRANGGTEYQCGGEWVLPGEGSELDRATQVWLDAMRYAEEQ